MFTCGGDCLYSSHKAVHQLNYGSKQMNKYEDIKKIIDILAQSPELNDEDFRKYKGLVVRMCELSEKYMEGK